MSDIGSGALNIYYFKKIRSSVTYNLTIASSRSRLSGRARQHPSNVLTLSGGYFDEINRHCYLTVIRAVLNINNQSTFSVIGWWLSEALHCITIGAAIFFSCSYIRGKFPSSAGKHRKVSIDNLKMNE